MKLMACCKGKFCASRTLLRTHPMTATELTSWHETLHAEPGSGWSRSSSRGFIIPATRPSAWICARFLLLSLSVLPHALTQTQAALDNSANNRAQKQTQTADQQNDNDADRVMTANLNI